MIDILGMAFLCRPSFVFPGTCSVFLSSLSKFILPEKKNDDVISLSNIFLE